MNVITLSPSPRVAVHTRALFPTTLTRRATGARGVAFATGSGLRFHGVRSADETIVAE